MGTGLYEEVSCNSESSVKKQLNDDEAVLDGFMGKVGLHRRWKVC